MKQEDSKNRRLAYRDLNSQTGYSVVSACLVTLHWKDKAANQVLGRCISTRQEGIICLFAVACCGFSAGLCYRFNASFILLLVFIFIAFLARAALYFRQSFTDPPGFSCPGVPTMSVVSIFFNIFLFAQGRHIIFFQSLILLGYCLFPLDVGALICLLIDNATVRLVVVAITIAWSSWAIYPFMSVAVNSRRKALALYLIFLMYIFVCFLIIAID